MKIIIQAGGIGSRMKKLTSLKPKSLISAKYMPIIFHVFNKYRNAEFIIIGDYKFDILDRYLETFGKDINYLLIQAKGKGNAAGINEAIFYIPENEPFMLLWSDIILSDSFCVNEIRAGCQVGVVDFPCSWSLVDGKLEQVQKAGSGVGGLYIFDNKSWFADFPDEGSFTKWLKSKKMPLTPISLMGSIDVGTLEAYNKINSTANRCRPYNKIEFAEGAVVKTGLTSEARLFIEREISWYERMGKYGFSEMPSVYKRNPLTLERIDGTNIFLTPLTQAQKRLTLDRMVAALCRMHRFESAPASSWDIYGEYFKKTIHRLQTIATSLPFAFDAVIRINGRRCVNVLYSPHILRQAVLDNLMGIKLYGPIHGDCQLTNTMVDRNGKIYFIDPRGYFGKSQILGDVRYDWAKLYYALVGNFDQFNVKNFELEISEGVHFKIHSGGWEFLADTLISKIPPGEGNINEIKLIHAIIWLSLASHAWEDFDSMCVAFYNGTLLFNEWMEENSDGK